MDAKQDQHPPMQGNDELAKALQGGLQFEETPMPGSQTKTSGNNFQNTNDSNPNPLADEPRTLGTALPQPDDDEEGDEPMIKQPHAKDTNDKPMFGGSNSSGSNNSDGSVLDKLKASALEELRPLVGKLNLPAEEKFDTLLLIIRSTDDQSLLDAAHDAARDITDDAKRAQALLDVIKEIDYFSSKR